jgi:hypothetical protein
LRQRRLDYTITGAAASVAATACAEQFRPAAGCTQKGVGQEIIFMMEVQV